MALKNHERKYCPNYLFTPFYSGGETFTASKNYTRIQSVPPQSNDPRQSSRRLFSLRWTWFSWISKIPLSNPQISNSSTPDQHALHSVIFVNKLYCLSAPQCSIHFLMNNQIHHHPTPKSPPFTTPITAALSREFLRPWAPPIVDGRWLRQSLIPVTPLINSTRLFFLRQSATVRI